MKTTDKTSYLILGSALLLSSCAQEDTPVDIPDGNDRRIIFHTSLPELTTKATEVATDVDYFHLTAFDESDSKLIADGKLKEYFDDVRVEKDADSQKTVSDLCVWPQPGQEADFLHFFSYYPALPSSASLVNKTDASASAVAIGYGIRSYLIAPDIADQVDFMTAYATGSMADNLFSGINLGFRHQLSRVEVKARSEHKSCDVEIAGVAIGCTPMQGDFEFQKGDTDGVWRGTSKGNATYIFRDGDAIITAGTEAVSIMGKKVDAENDNCAMVIPSTAAAWDYSKDIHNENKGLYLNVLLRIIDKTPTDNGKQRKQQYPYYDNSQGLNAMNIEKVYLAVDKATGKNVVCQLYKDGDSYFTDKDFKTAYSLSDNEMVKEFGWAAVPVSSNWEPGMIYTYTLDYTYGVGVHGPEIPGEVAPMAGDPIISDRVGVSLGFKDWTKASNTGIEVPGN